MKNFLIAGTLFCGLTACSPPDNGHWLGYIEAEPALIAAPQPGWITSVEVARGSNVKVGQALFTLDATREIASRDNARAAIVAAKGQAEQADAQIAQAQAERSQIEADLLRNQQELARQENLVQMGASPRRDLETAQATYEGSRARRNQVDAVEAQAAAARRQSDAQTSQAESSLVTAEFNLSQRSVHALVAGQVQEIFFRQGEYANAGIPVVSVLPSDNVFVRFFVPETALSRVSLGKRVHISCDGCAPDLVATITFIAAQSEFTPPVIYSVGTREKLVFKGEARVTGAEGPITGLPLHPGLPVEVWLAETGRKTAAPLISEASP